MALLKGVDILPEKEDSYFEAPRFDLPFQLRFLGISTHSNPNGMVDNLVNLEYIHVRGSTYGVVPSVILRMAKLRHLQVERIGVFEEECNISETTNLRSISFFVIQREMDEEILRKSPHLQTLKLECKYITPDLSRHDKLETLRLNFENCILDVDIKFPSSIKKICLCASRLPWGKMSVIGELPNLEVLKLNIFAFVGEQWETN